MNDFIIGKIEMGIKDNYELMLEYSSNIDYCNQTIVWNNKSYFIKNIKIDHIIKEIKEFINIHKKDFVKLSINNMSKNIGSYFINIPWEIINVEKISTD